MDALTMKPLNGFRVRQNINDAVLVASLGAEISSVEKFGVTSSTSTERARETTQLWVTQNVAPERLTALG